MSFTARLIITDLCALMRPQGQGELHVLLVKAIPSTPDQEAAGMHRHDPLLGISPGHLSPDPGNRTPDRFVPELTGDTLAIFDIPGEELAFSTLSPLEFESDPLPATREPGSLQEERNLNWIVSLKSFSNSPVRPDLDDLTNGPVISRIRIAGGRVTCKRVVRDANGGYQKFDFRSDPANGTAVPSRALGDLVQVELIMPSIEENGGNPQIVSSSGRGIYILPATNAPAVNLVVGNMTLDPQVPAPEGLAPHFRWFYELLQPPPAIPTRVIPFVASSGPLNASRPNAPCPQILME
jgi:hypothetical protein